MVGRAHRDLHWCLMFYGPLAWLRSIGTNEPHTFLHFFGGHSTNYPSLPDLFRGFNIGKRITLEHSHFGIALEHKMLHHLRPQPTNQTSDLLTGAALWKARAFQNDVSTCLYQKTTPMRDLVLTSSLPLSWLLLLSDLGIHYGRLSSHFGFIWGEGEGFTTSHLGFI